jgi:hypothetical protein
LLFLLAWLFGYCGQLHVAKRPVIIPAGRKKDMTEGFWGAVILAAVLFTAVEIMERCMGDEDG